MSFVADLSRNGTWLASWVFATIVASLVSWNVYISTVARRRRNAALHDSTAFYDIAVCSSSAFTYEALRLTLDGLRSSTGYPARVVPFEQGSSYPVVIIDLVHPGQAVGNETGQRIGVYMGPHRPKATTPVDVAFGLPSAKAGLTRQLALMDDEVAVIKPTPLVWLLLVVAVVFVALLVWSGQ
jgi:hypothetical protein